VTRARDVVGGGEFTIRSRVLINAAGPFVDELNRLSGVPTVHHHAFSKGVHLIVPRITARARVLTFFADDGRLFFAIPMGTRTVIGTTDTPVHSPFVEVTDEDRRFVLDNIKPAPSPVEAPGARRRDRRALRRAPAAVRGEPGEFRDFLQLSRRHAVETDAARGHISIFGGKLTDCLNVGEEICRDVERLGVSIPDPRSRGTASHPTRCGRSSCGRPGCWTSTAIPRRSPASR